MSIVPLVPPYSEDIEPVLVHPKSICQKFKHQENVSQRTKKNYDPSWKIPLAKTMILNLVTACVANMYSFTLFNYFYTVGTASIPLILCTPINKKKNYLLYKVQAKVHNVVTITFLLSHIFTNLSNPSLQGCATVVTTVVYVWSTLAQKSIIYSPKKPSFHRFAHKKTMLYYFALLRHIVTLALYTMTPLPQIAHHRATHYNTILRSGIRTCYTITMLWWDSQKHAQAQTITTGLFCAHCQTLLKNTCIRTSQESIKKIKLLFIRYNLFHQTSSVSIAKKQIPKKHPLHNKRKGKLVVFKRIIYQFVDILPF